MLNCTDNCSKAFMWGKEQTDRQTDTIEKIKAPVLAFLPSWVQYHLINFSVFLEIEFDDVQEYLGCHEVIHTVWQYGSTTVVICPLS